LSEGIAIFDEQRSEHHIFAFPTSGKHSKEALLISSPALRKPWIAGL
jgi:hypothetical protein